MGGGRTYFSFTHMQTSSRLATIKLNFTSRKHIVHIASRSQRVLRAAVGLTYFLSGLSKIFNLTRTTCPFYWTSKREKRQKVKTLTLMRGRGQSFFRTGRGIP